MSGPRAAVARCAVLLAGAALAAAGCGASPRGRDVALVHDAQECEELAERELRGAPEPGIRLALFESCMVLRGWTGR